MSGGKFHANHGRDHAPDGLDPARAGKWHKVGDPGEPPFLNGWSNAGGSYGPTRFRLVVGAVGNETVGANTRQSLEIVLAVTGGTTGSVIFTLPAGYFDWCNGEDVPGSGHDNTGTYRAWRINGATGDVTDGV